MGHRVSAIENRATPNEAKVSTLSELHLAAEIYKMDASLPLTCRGRGVQLSAID
jgi:hypothetical protein